MGAVSGKGSNKLAISAMSHVVKFNKNELLKMQKVFKEQSTQARGRVRVGEEGVASLGTLPPSLWWWRYSVHNS